MKRVIYFKDELNDDFSGMNMKKPPLPENFRYVRKNPFYRAACFLFYRIIATPVAYAVCKIHYGVRYVNRKIIKKHKGGCFLYANHTMAAGDAFSPSLAAFPKNTRIIVGREAVSNKFLRAVVPMLGGLPVPDGLKQTCKFRKAVEEYIKRKNCVTVYPEAHIWKYYTGIRPFTDVSFRYPAELSAPVFAATVTYEKRKIFSRPRAVVYIDGPFYPDMTLNLKERRKVLRDQVYTVMLSRAKNSNCEYVKYVYSGEDADKLSA
ncbi:MAG: 1-acyl-sn-glycerol-3-phosphate acyltransferase [Clostridia bacterium]|nr:1-acyl-sn-glycerol-3-phosphate acyltransferase [Clostridia bacterium]